MRVITALAAVAALLIGISFGYDLLVSEEREPQPTGEWVIAGVIVSCGILLLVATIRNYQGSWPFLIGLGNLMLAMICMLLLLEDGPDEEVIVILAYFAVTGVLLLYSGQQLHTLRRSFRGGGFDLNIFE